MTTTPTLDPAQARRDADAARKRLARFIDPLPGSLKPKMFRQFYSELQLATVLNAVTNHVDALLADHARLTEERDEALSAMVLADQRTEEAQRQLAEARARIQRHDVLLRSAVQMRNDIRHISRTLGKSDRGDDLALAVALDAILYAFDDLRFAPIHPAPTPPVSAPE